MKKVSGTAMITENRIAGPATAFTSLFLILVCHSAGAYFECPYRGPAEEEQLVIDIEHYRLDLHVDMNNLTLAGEVEMSCVSKQNDLVMVPIDLVELQVDEVLVNGNAAVYQYDMQEIAVTLDHSYDAGEPFTLTVGYHGGPEEGLEWKRGTAYNAMVEASRWFPCYHEPLVKSTAEIRVTVPTGYKAACNGLLEETIEGENEITYIWREYHPMASYLFTVNIDQYVTFSNDYHGMELVYFVFPDDLAAAQADFQNDTAIMAMYEDWFGLYPFDKYGCAEVRILGAMENQDMVSYGKALIKGDRRYETTFAHEMSHMWWGDSVTLADCADVWLNEGFASYCEVLWLEYFYGAEDAAAHLAHFAELYFGEDALPDGRFPIYDPPPEQVWSYTVYKKGAWVLHMLRDVVGETVFRDILSTYYQRHVYGNAVIADFQAVCEEIHGADLDWFFSEWIYAAGFPVYAWDWRSSPGRDGNAVLIAVDQVQDASAPIFRMPLSFELKNGEQEQRVTATVDARFHTIRVETDWEPEEVVFDPDGWILYQEGEMTRPGPPVLMAGTWNSRIGASEGGLLTLLAFCPDTPYGPAGLELMLGDDPTGLFLGDDGEHGDFDAGDGIFGLVLDFPPGVLSDAAGTWPIGIQSSDGFGFSRAAWPALEVQ
ncbi:M1 family metallopeptidase [bacterium]|nr:M1 family metallopeptidase [candidate division CSSED10-310 bacterium]